MGIVLAVLALALGANPPTLIANDDRDVIQSALLTFFQPEPWHSGDWKPKKHLVLHPVYDRNNGRDFRAQAAYCRDHFRTGLKHLRENIRKASPKEKPYYTADFAKYEKGLAAFQAVLDKKWPQTGFKRPRVVPIPKLVWDRRIVVTEESGRFMWRTPSETRNGIEEWTVEASATLPSYSPDGSMAIIQFNIPWSIHSADVIFLMERTPDGWKRRAVCDIFYV